MEQCSSYRLQIKQGSEWEDFDCLPASSEDEAWVKLDAWSRYCPKDQWRWVRDLGTAV